MLVSSKRRHISKFLNHSSSRIRRSDPSERYQDKSRIDYLNKIWNSKVEKLSNSDSTNIPLLWDDEPSAFVGSPLENCALIQNSKSTSRSRDSSLFDSYNSERHKTCSSKSISLSSLIEDSNEEHKNSPFYKRVQQFRRLSRRNRNRRSLIRKRRFALWPAAVSIFKSIIRPAVSKIIPTIVSGAKSLFKLPAVQNTLSQLVVPGGKYLLEKFEGDASRVSKSMARKLYSKVMKDPKLVAKISNNQEINIEDHKNVGQSVLLELADFIKYSSRTKIVNDPRLDWEYHLILEGLKLNDIINAGCKSIKDPSDELDTFYRAITSF